MTECWFFCWGASGNSIPQAGGSSAGANSSGGAKGEDECKASAAAATPGASSGGGGEEEEEAQLPPGLVRWREAVGACQTAAQLAMCLAHLEASIAWDRSIMKAVSGGKWGGGFGGTVRVVAASHARGTLFQCTLCAGLCYSVDRL